MQLPYEVREALVMAVDEYLETVNEDPDAGSLAEYVVETLEASAEVHGVEDAEELISRIEEHAALDESLVDTLEYEFSNADELGLTGEEIVSLIEKVCGIEWEERDDDLFDDDDDPFDDV